MAKLGTVDEEEITSEAEASVENAEKKIAKPEMSMRTIREAESSPENITTEKNKNSNRSEMQPTLATKLKPEGGYGAELGSRREYGTMDIEAKLGEESNLSEAQLRKPSRQTELRVALDQASSDIKRLSMELCSNRWFAEKVRSDLNSNSISKNVQSTSDSHPSQEIVWKKTLIS